MPRKGGVFPVRQALPTQFPMQPIVIGAGVCRARTLDGTRAGGDRLQLVAATASRWEPYADMSKKFAGGIYVIAAIRGKHVEYWAAATPRDVAVATVQQLLGPGWTAGMTQLRLTTDQAAALKLPPNCARRLGPLKPEGGVSGANGRRKRPAASGPR